MFDATGLLVYVGKAKDLQARLNSYRRTHGQSRKTIRLIHDVRRIEWDVCASETEARLREAALIRTLRPRFNRAGTWPRSARYLALAETAGGFRLSLTAEPVGESYGVFRGGAGFALAALGRLLLLALFPGRPVGELPHGLLAVETVRRWGSDAPGATSWLPDLRTFLGGIDDRLVARLVDQILPPTSSFEELFVAAQFAIVEDFYRRGPWLNRQLREQFPSDRPDLAPEERDDLLIQARREIVAERLGASEGEGFRVVQAPATNSPKEAS